MGIDGKVESTIKVEVSTHGGDVDIIEVEDYNASDLEESLNDNKIHAIAIGSNIYSRIDIKNIKLVTEKEDIE